jgi:hypothetical protein
VVRWLQVAVVGMGVLIVAGVVVIVVALTQRMSSAPGAIASAAVLDEPAGTRIAGTALSADRLAIQLQGGGPDRVLVFDLKAGRVLGRVALAR